MAAAAGAPGGDPPGGPGEDPFGHKDDRIGDYLDGRRKSSVKIKWDAEADRKLLLWGLCKKITGAEYDIIAGTFPGKICCLFGVRFIASVNAVVN